MTISIVLNSLDLILSIFLNFQIILWFNFEIICMAIHQMIGKIINFAENYWTKLTL